LNILLSKPLPTQNSTILEGFWPSSNWKFNHMWGAIPPIVDIDHEDPIVAPYYGFKKYNHHWRQLAYTSFWNLGLRDFVLVRPTHPKLYLVWMG
jgi:hypothetical protein